MKIIRKIGTVLGSVLMIGATVGMAAAATFPAPFVEGGAANAAIVVGANAAPTDWAASTTVYSKLSSSLAGATAGGTGSSTTVVGTAWEVGTSSDDLELGEAMYSVKSFIDAKDLSILADGTISNEKGTANYKQYLYFEDQASQNVSYMKNDDDIVGLFLRIDDGNQIARYVMDFTSALTSDSIAASRLEDIEGEDITILGKTYTIIKAENKTNAAADADVELTLMSGANKGTVSNDEEITVGGRAVSVVVSSATQAQFTIDGQTTNKLNEGDTYKLSDDTYLGVADITYQEFSGGIMQSTFYVGADKIELFNGSSMKVNAVTMGDAAVEIESSNAGGDVSITSIKVNISAEDDLFIPIDGKLSENADLTKPGVLFTQNWDMQFKGLEAHETEELTLTSTSSDQAAVLTFSNYDGYKIALPLIFTNGSGTYGGASTGHDLVLCANDSMSLNETITKDDYFILNTADPRLASRDARSYVLEYTGSDKNNTENPKYHFKVLGATKSEDSINEPSMHITSGRATLTLGGTTFTITNRSTTKSKDAQITFIGSDYCDGAANASVSQYIRTKNNALINITDSNRSTTQTKSIAGKTKATGTHAWRVNVSIDDVDRDGDDNTFTTVKEQVFFVTLVNGSATDPDYTTSFTGDGKWITDDDDSYLKTFQTRYGAIITDVSASSAPDQITVTIPNSIVRPLVYISSGDISVTSTGGVSGATELGEITIYDNQVASESGKNLIVVGGSCINTVAAKLLGSDTPICAEAFTTKTGVGDGQYLIQTFTSPYASDKVAMLVAGYNAADTTKAVQFLKNNAVDTTLKYTGSTPTDATSSVVTA